MTAPGPGPAPEPDEIDLLDEELVRAPFTVYSRLRERRSLHRAVMPGLGAVWIVTRHDDVRAVLSDPRLVNDVVNVPEADVPNMSERAAQAGGVPPEYIKYVYPTVVDIDGAAHARLRRLVAPAFTARRVERLRPRVEEIAARLLDRLPEAAEDGVVDLIPHFARPLPITVICELVGIPEADRGRWVRWSGALAAGTEPMGEAVRGMVEDTRRLIGRRRARPADDLISTLIRAQQTGGGDRLDDTELINLVLSLVVAGHETTSGMIAEGVAALLSHPGQLDLIRRDPPAVLPRAVHEVMRWRPPVLLTRVRYARADLEIGGQRVARGERVMPILAAAGHDPRSFPAPEHFDITRSANRRETHVSFGYGPHYCMGAALARQEGEVAFGALLRRFPGLALAVAPEDLERSRADGATPGTWRLGALPVRL
ncbi:cytochrome P450 [Actinomadura viridis]|uniref:cytochrome P450 family protein n=1 Tax=Actinomadura viridis TaxID=58110 RepID=UPI0036AE63D4